MATTAQTDLVTVLEELGVDVFKVHGDEVNGRCPVHHKVKGRESSRNSWYINVDSGLWHCFTCGARGNLSQLLSELSADPESLWKVQSHLITTGLRRLSSEEAAYQPDVREDVDWPSFLRTFHPLPQSVLDYRQLDPDVANRFGVRWDPEEKATILPIVSPIGELKGWQAKKTGWVRNRPEGVNKSITLFGIERAFGDIGVLVESPLDVVRFHSVYDDPNVNCVSSFGANVSAEQIRLLSSRFRRLIVALDNDQAGETESKRLAKRLDTFRDGIRWWHYAPDDPKDLGEMSDAQILRGLANVSAARV